jgi:hypothetical protein
VIATRPETDSPGNEENASIAAALSDYADLLEAQGEDGFRIRAFRRASDTIFSLARPLRDVFRDEGLDGLVALPGIGRGIGAAIVEMLTTGKWTQLERLKGDSAPEELFRTLPGVGPVLARRLAEDCDLESLEDLEDALHSGTPEIAGIGPRRRKALEAILSERLGRRLRRPPAQKAASPPEVGMLLDVDRIYRDRATAGTLRKIAPRRFNPEGRAWLPILHARHGDWHFTALYSNTARAHDLGKTRDWVVIYSHFADGPEQRYTVVTETHGPMAGERVVRGRERECEALFRSGTTTDAAGSAGPR